MSHSGSYGVCRTQISQAINLKWSVRTLPMSCFASCDDHLFSNGASRFPDHGGTTSQSLHNFHPELNKLNICLGKCFLLSPGLCENSGTFQTIQTGDCKCRQGMIACVCMNVCLSVYMPPRGVEVCVLTVLGVQTLISTLSPSQAFIWKQSGETER